MTVHYEEIWFRITLAQSVNELQELSNYLSLNESSFSPVQYKRMTDLISHIGLLLSNPN